jgi:tetratricopeptide (TPR) repeat protein
VKKVVLSSVISLLLLCLLNACSATLEIEEIRQSRNITSFKRVDIKVPFFPQKEYQCGPAALAMLLNWSNTEVTPEELKPLVYVPAKQGSFPIEMVAAVRSFNRIPYVIKPTVATLIQELEAGNPVLVFQNLGLDWLPRWHFAVVIGIDIASNQITLHSGTIEKHTMTLDTFERTWRRAKKWAMVVMSAGQLPSSADSLKYIKAVSYFEKKGQLEFAKKSYQSAVGRWPDDLLVLMGIANISYQVGMLKNAVKYYQQVIDIDIKYAPAHNNLALALMEQGRLPEAHQHAVLAIKLGGALVQNYQDTLSQVNRQLSVGAQ